MGGEGRERERERGRPAEVVENEEVGDVEEGVVDRQAPRHVETGQYVYMKVVKIHDTAEIHVKLTSPKTGSRSRKWS